VRKAAGILMVITAIVLLVVVAVSSAALGGWITYDNFMDVLFLVFCLAWVGFIIMGGVFCLQRKHWSLCFTSSLFLLLLMILLSLSLPPPITWVALFLIPGGILPITFVCLKKREWEGSYSKIRKIPLKIRVGGERVSVLWTGEKGELRTLDTEVQKIEGVFKCLSKVDKSLDPLVEDEILIHLQCLACLDNKKFCREVMTLMERELTEKMQKETRIDDEGFIDLSRG
jgi:hypothetical protein